MPAWEGARNLSTEAIRQTLAEAQLTTTGTRQTLIRRLRNHITQQQQQQDNQSPPTSDEEAPTETPTPDRASLKSLTLQQKEEVMELIRKSSGGSNSVHMVASEASSDTEVDEVGTTSDDSETDVERQDRRRKRKHKRPWLPSSKRHRHQREVTPPRAQLFANCGTLLPQTVAKKISKGEYTDFNELLYDRRMHGLGSTPLHLSVEESVGETPSLSISTQKTPKRVVTNLSTWMEAWNRALPIMAAAQPSRVIEYIKYQTFIALASERYEPEAWISYDQDLRRQLAEDPFHTAHY